MYIGFVYIELYKTREICSFRYFSLNEICAINVKLETTYFYMY